MLYDTNISKSLRICRIPRDKPHISLLKVDREEAKWVVWGEQGGAEHNIEAMEFCDKRNGERSKMQFVAVEVECMEPSVVVNNL